MKKTKVLDIYGLYMPIGLFSFQISCTNFFSKKLCLIKMKSEVMNRYIWKNSVIHRHAGSQHSIWEFVSRCRGKKKADWQLIDILTIHCLSIFVFCGIEKKTRKGVEATKRWQKIKKSMGRRNVICLSGCSRSFCLH